MWSQGRCRETPEDKGQQRRLVQAMEEELSGGRWRLAVGSGMAPASLEISAPALNDSNQHPAVRGGRKPGWLTGGQDLGHQLIWPQGLFRVWLRALTPQRQYFCHLPAKEASQVAQAGGD